MDVCVSYIFNALFIINIPYRNVCILYRNVYVLYIRTCMLYRSICPLVVVIQVHRMRLSIL